MDESRLMVTRLSANVTEAHIREIFSRYGTVPGVYVPTDRRLRRHRGKAFVQCAEGAGAAAALTHMNGGQLDGNVL